MKELAKGEKSGDDHGWVSLDEAGRHLGLTDV